MFCLNVVFFAFLKFFFYISLIYLFIYIYIVVVDLCYTSYVLEKEREDLPERFMNTNLTSFIAIWLLVYNLW